jgi:hypothetical protein
MMIVWCGLGHLLFVVHHVDCFSTDLRKRLPGIWKLTVQDASVGTSTKNSYNLIVDDLVQIQPKQPPTSKEILLKLQANGRFRQCDEGYQEGKWLSGRWELLNNNNNSSSNNNNNNNTTLCLALDRQYFGPPHDTLLKGDLLLTTTASENDNDNENSRLQQQQQQQHQDSAANKETTSLALSVVFHGSVKIGKFDTSKQDPAFFDTEPILIRESTSGSFVLEQMLAFLRLLPPETAATNTLEVQEELSNDVDGGFLVSGQLGSDDSPDDDDTILFGSCAFQ